LNASSPFTLAGPDTSLSLSNGTLTFTTSDNFAYPLRRTSILDGHDPGHPGRIWTNLTSSTHEPVNIQLPVTLRIETDVVNGTRVWVNESFAGRFEVFVYGGRNTLFSWSQMAFVAPLDSVEGGVAGFLLEDGIVKSGGSGSGSGLPVSNGAGKNGAWMSLLLGVMVVCFLS
jgi:hexosaminidase